MEGTSAAAPIPIIDISPALRSSGVGDHRVVAARLRDAIRSVGFVQIVGHGFDRSLLDDAYDAMRAVELDWTAEQRASMDRPRASSRGLFRRWDDDGFLDRMIFQFIPYDDVADAEAKGACRGRNDFFTPNVWPEFDPGFTETWKRYEEASRFLCRVLLDLFADALDLPFDFFEPVSSRDVSLHSVNWYPPQPAGAIGDEAVVLNPAHADSGLVTLLHQRGSYEGLEVRIDGDWVKVPAIDEAFVVNIGHLMRRVTNGQWPATIHRVVSGTTVDDERHSIATHFIPDIDAVLGPVPSTIDADGPRFSPISTYAWQQEFMERYVLEQWSEANASAR